jgi:hypothetical protein
MTSSSALMSLFSHSSRTTESPEETNRRIIEQCLKQLKELFRANGEGLDDEFLMHYSRQLQILLGIYMDPTDVLIELYQRLTDIEQQLYDIDDTISIDSPTRMNEADSDNISVASSDSSISTGSSIILIQTIQSKLANQQLNRNELLKPEYILLLLGTRKKDREARKFVKQTLKRKNSS